MLVEQRLQWLGKFKEGLKPSSSVLIDYRKHRLSEVEEPLQELKNFLST